MSSGDADCCCSNSDSDSENSQLVVSVDSNLDLEWNDVSVDSGIGKSGDEPESEQRPMQDVFGTDPDPEGEERALIKKKKKKQEQDPNREYTCQGELLYLWSRDSRGTSRVFFMRMLDLSIFCQIFVVFSSQKPGTRGDFPTKKMFIFAKSFGTLHVHMRVKFKKT